MPYMMPFWQTVMDSAGDLPYGKRLVPSTVDNIAETDPDQVCFSFPRSPNAQDGFRDITFRTFARAVNKTAHFIQREIGVSSMFETVMYLGVPDVRHFVALVALMKTGHKVLFSSHENSVAGHADLIKRTDCTILLHTASFPISSILQKCRMETLCMPELEFLLDESPCKPFPYTKSFEGAKHHPCLVVHTSGSTGLPKPIVYTQWSLATSDAHQLVPPLDGRPTICSLFNSARRTFCGLPIFHGPCIAAAIEKACFNNTTIVLGPPVHTSANAFEQALASGDIDAAICLPSTLMEIATRPDILAKLAGLKFITYFGGSLPKNVGDTICRFTPLYNILASTEAKCLVQHATDVGDWQYICLNPASGVEMRPTAGLYELAHIRLKDHPDFQNVFKVFPRAKEYSTSDLFSRHPTKMHHWMHFGRKDDMVVFQKSGKIFDPKVHEQYIKSHPVVSNCVLLGIGKDRLAAIIQLRKRYYTESENEQRELLNAIWPRVHEANKLVDPSFNLDREYIIFAKKEKPFAVAVKGNVRRKSTGKMYDAEIEQLDERDVSMTET